MKFRLLLCILALVSFTLPCACPDHRGDLAVWAGPGRPLRGGRRATGETLLDRNAGAFWHPASLTKMMTIYIVFEELKAGRLTLATPMALSEVARAKPPSKLGLAAGQGHHRRAGPAGAGGALGQ
jgi:hypothetical protein